MEFKIDTKPVFTTITPESELLDEKMAEELCHKIKDLIQLGSRNFIVDLKNCRAAEMTSGSVLIELHSLIYSNNGSLVFTELQELVLQSMKKEQLHLSLNITPTFVEATDIIHMEVLERDLLNEL